MKSRRVVEFRAVDALAFADAFRFGIRMSTSDLETKIRAERSSGAMGPAALKGLEFALSHLAAGTIPAVVRYEVEVEVDGEADAPEGSAPRPN